MAAIVPAMGFALLSVITGVTIDTLVKLFMQDVSLLTLMVGRYAFGSILAISVFLVTGWASGRSISARLPDRNGYVLHLIRALMQLCTALSFFYGLFLLPLPMATILGFTSALILPFVAWPILGERPSVSAIIAVGLGFLGSVIAITGSSSTGATALQVTRETLLGVLLCVASAVSYALILTLVRRRAETEDNATINLFVTVVPGLILFAFFALDGSLLSRIDFVVTSLVFETAVLGLLGYITWFLIILAYRRADPQYLAPLEYTALIWSAVVSAVVFNQPATWPVWLGGGIIVFACLYSALHRQFINRRKTRMPTSRSLR